MISKGYRSCELEVPCVPIIPCKILSSSNFLFLRRRAFKAFTIYGLVGHPVYVSFINFMNFCPPYPRQPNINVGTVWPSGKEKQMLKIMVL